MSKSIVNWDELLNTNSNRNLFAQFARGNISGIELYEEFVGTVLGGEVRRLVRRGGVDRSRSLVRQALKRRGVAV